MSCYAVLKEWLLPRRPTEGFRTNPAPPPLFWFLACPMSGWIQDRRKRQRREGQRKEVVDYKEAVLDVLVTTKDR